MKQEADAEPGETAPLTLTEMHIPSEQDDGPTLSDPDVIPSQPLRSQSVQLPIFGSEMAHTEARVALPVISTLNQAPSLPSNVRSRLHPHECQGGCRTSLWVISIGWHSTQVLHVINTSEGGLDKRSYCILHLQGDPPQ